MNLFNIPAPRRDDEKNAKRWRGPLFWGWGIPISWWTKKGYEKLDPPKSVTFPICAFCQHIVWEWPHFEEEVPHNAVCEQCFKEEEEANERENNRGDR